MAKATHFARGADLEWMKKSISQSKTENINDAKLLNLLFETIYSFPTPVICEVQNSAFGAAVGLIACADIVICEPASSFGFPEGKVRHYSCQHSALHTFENGATATLQKEC